LGDILTAEPHPERPIQLIALKHQRAVDAQSLQAARAPAGRPEPGMKEVTMWSPTLNPPTPGPTASTPSPSSPPENGRVPGADVTRGGMIIGMAQACGNDTDEHLVVPRRIKLDPVYLPLAREFPHERRCCLPGFPLLRYARAGPSSEVIDLRERSPPLYGTN
jgi:hypothetical protein